MPGHAGNYYTQSIGRQTAKATPQTTPLFKTRVTGSGLRPDRQIEELQETDNSRQAQPTVVVGSRVGGAVTHYLRSDEYALMAYGVMGANGTSGAGPYTHDATMSGAAPYFTLYEAFDATALVSRFVDCRIIRQVIRGQVGGIITVENTWAGITAGFGETDPVSPAPSTVVPLLWPHVTVTKGGSVDAVVSEFEITIDNGGEYVEGDVGMEPVDYVFGRWVVTGQLMVLFETDADYRAFHTGSPTGTVPTAEIFTEALNVTASRDAADDEVQWDFAAVEYQSYEIAPDPGGSPIRVPMAFRAKAQPAVADTLTISTKNLVAAI